MDVALSPMRTQDLDPMPSDASPMLINMTPTVDGDEEEDVMKELDSGQQYDKPPPLHTGADWKIVLHLPEIETWLRMTSERVRDLTYSVQQDSDSRHVDVHLVQLKHGVQLKLKSWGACGCHLHTASGQLRVQAEVTCASW
ncbi:A-kinase anchor protein 6-like [Phasianus colchicus]|uniref:A-kinase anchor protein 6-like n=1 Tax=Phasianus colchicus TaxID=9054 RepID=UPI00129D6F32|nr:A-kinase anchor protein 6-like [Phasianus colchicus]